MALVPGPTTFISILYVGYYNTEFLNSGPIVLAIIIFFGGLECVGHFFANVVHFVLLRDVRIQTQRAAVASRRANNLATHLPIIYIIILQDITELAVLWTLDQAAIPTTLISTASRKHKIHEIKPTRFSAEINLACELRHCLAGHRSTGARPTFREY